jgi:hypothetical protein
MSFTYAELKTAIQDFTENNEPSFVRNIPLFIRQAEERILKNVQLDLFRQNATGQMRAGTQYLEVPNDFLAPFSLSYSNNPFPYGSHESSSQYNISNSISRANIGFAGDVALFQTPEAISGRSLGDIQGQNDGNVEQQDALLMTQYIVYKYGGGSIGDLTTANISYIEDTMLPYMAARQSTYSNFYNPTAVGSNFMDYKDASFVREYQGEDGVTGKPRYYAQFNEDNFILAPKPDSNYSVQLSYFYRPTSLTAGAEDGTTWLSKNAEMAMLYGSLIEAGVYMKEEPDIMQMYQSRFQESLMGIKMLGEAKQTTDEYRVGKVVRQKQ